MLSIDFGKVAEQLKLVEDAGTQITDFFFIFPCPEVNILYLSMQTLVA